MKRRIAVMTDLDMAEHRLADGKLNEALVAATVALENALSHMKEYEEHSEEYDAWIPIVQRAYGVKSRVLRAISESS